MFQIRDFAPQTPKCDTMTKTLSKTKDRNVWRCSQLMLVHVKRYAAKVIFHDFKAAVFDKVHT